MDPEDLDPDPIAQFHAWYDPSDASVCLATASPSGPDARMVLLKGADAGGFVFFTNATSTKGQQLAVEPSAALVFHWPPRQVRVRGRVELVSDAESDAYWVTRPRGSQLGAWASQQSTVLSSRGVLEERLAAVTAEFEGREVPRPAYWRGYRIVPRTIEFWHHRDDRLHDRVRYRREEEGAWTRERLAP
ncbi:MAG TPA: pyridoxamine 5'-phosphate oxidase [Acidimicrobiales bacterium]|jgi:pyridoxamine 5'-phosphate oxidase|nr:pyridoxamine 5'-phosphate oxidase [Acidimicrobiales bacterium]